MSELIRTSSINSLDKELNCSEQLDNKPNRRLTGAELVISHEKCMILVEQLLNDKSVELLEYFENKKPNEKFDSVLDCTFYSVVSAYIALVNLYPEDIAKSVTITKECVAYCNARRKKWSLTTAVAQVLRIKSDGQAYTDEEALAEICYAGLMMIRGALNFVRDNNFFTMISGSVMLKVAHQSFKLCKHIMNDRKWDNPELEIIFLQGTKLGLGIYNMVLAMIPKRILRILELIGFTGDRKLGLQLLLEGCSGTSVQSIGGLLCFVFLFGYVVKLKYLLGIGSSAEEIEMVEKMAVRLTTKYPNSTALLYVRGRIEHLKGNVEQAIALLQKSIEKKSKRVLVQVLSLWDLGSLYIGKSEPRQAAQLIQKMRLNSNVTKCCFAYMEAVFLLSASDLNEEDEKYAIELLEMVPNIMAEYCGKHVPWEKFCVRKARQFFAQDNFLVLPEYEIMYTFNTFFMLKDFPGKLEEIIVKCDTALSKLEPRKDWHFYTDCYCVGIFLKGLCLKYLKKYDEAERHFQDILSKENDIYSEVYLPMCSNLELGLIYTETGQLEKALKFLSSSKKRRMFWVEFRVHQAKEDVQRLIAAQNNNKN